MKQNSYKGFTLRRIKYWSGGNLEKSDDYLGGKLVTHIEWLIIRDNKVLDRAFTVRTAKARIDSGLYNKKA
jgi:hypothetical protein